MESDDEFIYYRDLDYDYLELLKENDLTPVRPSKNNTASRTTHKEWLKERKILGDKRSDRKTKAITKRLGSGDE